MLSECKFLGSLSDAVSLLASLGVWRVMLSFSHGQVLRCLYNFFCRIAAAVYNVAAAHCWPLNNAHFNIRRREAN